MVKQKSTNKTNDFDIIEPKDEHGIRYLASLNEELEQFLETFPKFKDLNIRIVFLGSENTVDYDNAKVPDESGSVAIGDGVQDEEIIIMLENVASITHEFGHMVDDYSINMGNRDIWSSDYKFAIIAHQYNKEIDKQIQNNIPKDRNYEFVRKDIKRVCLSKLWNICKIVSTVLFRPIRRNTTNKNERTIRYGRRNRTNGVSRT